MEELKLPVEFFRRDVLEVAPDLLGKVLARRLDNGKVLRAYITDVEVYRGEEDKACHAHKGRTARTETLYAEGGVVYVYLIYGLYWILNIVTGDKDSPQGIMIRAIQGVYGPGRVGKFLELDKSLKGEPVTGDKLWIEESYIKPEYTTAPRIGIDYAKEWKDIEWRFILDEKVLR